MGPKFDPAWAARLNDPARLEKLDPSAMWGALACPSAAVIADIGAGAGLLTTAFARLAPAARLFAVDVSAEMLEWMRAHLAPDVAGRIEPVLAQETRIPLADGVADVVTMIALYHELDDAPATLAEAHRLLVPGGRLLVVDWKREPTEGGPPFEHRVATADILAAVASAGFEDAEQHEVLEGFSVVTGTRP